MRNWSLKIRLVEWPPLHLSQITGMQYTVYRDGRTGTILNCSFIAKWLHWNQFPTMSPVIFDCIFYDIFNAILFRFYETRIESFMVQNFMMEIGKMIKSYGPWKLIVMKLGTCGSKKLFYIGIYFYCHLISDVYKNIFDSTVPMSNQSYKNDLFQVNSLKWIDSFTTIVTTLTRNVSQELCVSVKSNMQL